MSPGSRPASVLTDNPKEVGTDRIVNTLAAYNVVWRAIDRRRLRDFYELLDVVSKNGEFLGGALAAGIEISVEAPLNAARSFGKVELVRPDQSSARTPLRPCSPARCMDLLGRWTASLTASRRNLAGR